MHFFLFFLLFSLQLFANDTPFFYVVVPSYNNETWCIKNLQSILNQEYKNYQVVIINDASTDKTGLLLERFIAERKLQQKVSIVHNKRRSGMLKNIYVQVKDIDPKWIVVTVDGDDTLRGPNAFTILKEVYKNDSIWMTYGSWVSEPPGQRKCNCQAFPDEVVKKRTFRSHPFISSQLRTFYAALFQKIKKKDLQHRGKFFMAAGDVAIMLPMLEMAADGHYHFIDQSIYTYNVENPINDFKVHHILQAKCAKQIREKKRYKKLKQLF